MGEHGHYHHWRNAMIRQITILVFPCLLVLLGHGCASSSREREREQIRKFMRARSLANDAGQLGANWFGTAPTQIPDAVLNQAKAYRKEILALASEIDPYTLNVVYPELGTMFSQTILLSNKISLEGAEKRDISLLQSALRLEWQWAEWYNPRIAEINEALRRRLG